ncbi:MAG: DUF441 domain-containing protein [Halanaerobiales bacterium]|nr:DUF441 domain-containing protein [Halanaerobiales bacterium]
MNSGIFLISLITLGFLARSRVIVLAALILILLKELKINPLLLFLSKKGIEIGLVFLLLAILAPLLVKPVRWQELKDLITDYRGVIAIIAGILATQANGMGLELLNELPLLIIGIIIGSLLGIVIFGGIPVGPLMAAGIAALLLKFFDFISRING